MSVKVRFIVPMRLFQSAIDHSDEDEAIRLNVCPVPLAYPGGLPVPEGWVECEVPGDQAMIEAFERQRVKLNEEALSIRRALHEEIRVRMQGPAKPPERQYGKGPLESARQHLAEIEHLWSGMSLADQESFLVSLEHHADCPARTSRHVECDCDRLYEADHEEDEHLAEIACTEQDIEGDPETDRIMDAAAGSGLEHQPMDWLEAEKRIVNEYARAVQLHGPFASAHEGLAVIREEYLELERVCFWERKARGDDEWLECMEHEATQLAAMALRFMVDARKATEGRG
jgi:hypothetical protein